MSADIIDVIGEGMLYCIPVTPFITIPLLLKYGNGKKIIRILLALFVALVLSLAIFAVSFVICFRNGMGPG